MDQSMFSFVYSLFVSAVIYSAPLIIIALGGLFSEKSGIVNIGLEGIATIGAFGSALGISLVHTYFITTNDLIPIMVGLLFGIFLGLIFALFHGYITIYLKVDQIISGTIINIVGLSLAIFLNKMIYGSATSDYLNIFPKTCLGIPIIIYFIFIIVILAHFIINKTNWGLNMKACGENPYAAKSVGINVNKIRMTSVLISGIFGSIGGTLLVILSSNNFSANTVAGKGFIALAILIFAKWKPLNILFTGMLFGFLSSLGVTADIIIKDPKAIPIWVLILMLIIIFICIKVIKNSIVKIILSIIAYFVIIKLMIILYTFIFFHNIAIAVKIPSVYYTILPYLLSIIALVIYSKDFGAPEALGMEFE